MKKRNVLKSLVAAAALLGSSMAFAATFMVTDVDSRDNLNVRSGPGANYAVIASIPPNGTGIGSAGEEVNTGTETWLKVSWQGQDGWVNKQYLVNMTQYTHPELGVSRQKRKSDYNVDVNTASAAPMVGVVKAAARPPVRKTNAVSYTHTHPAIPGCTNSITHSHPNGNRPHTHHYGCKPQAARPAVRVVRAAARPPVQPAIRVYNKSGQSATIPSNLSYDQPSYTMKTKMQPKIPAYLR